VLQGDLAWIRLHEFGITKPLPVPGGLVQMGDVHYSGAMYLTHRPGDVKPTGVPVTQSRITLRDNLDNMPFWRVAMAPSAAYPTVPGSSVMDGFFTRYAP
jgi:hypothetical protein